MLKGRVGWNRPGQRPIAALESLQPAGPGERYESQAGQYDTRPAPSNPGKIGEPFAKVKRCDRAGNHSEEWYQSSLPESKKRKRPTKWGNARSEVPSAGP